MEGFKSTIGVGMIELALGKLYQDPSVIYREYIQNACDGLEMAIREGLIQPKEAVISITIDRNEISIKDRGVGVSMLEIGPKLVNPGNSVKYKDNLIGQYGIGRLIAAQYCEKIVFETSFKGENKKSILTWDTKKAFEMINSHIYDDGTDVIDKVTSVVYEPEDINEHYFRVKLCGISRTHELLTDVQHVKEYVSLIAPVDYSMEFKEGYLYPALNKHPEYLELYKKERVYKVVINEEDIRKPYSIEIPDKDTELMEPLFMKFEDPDDGVLGWGWYSLNNKVIQMNNVLFRGIRFRKLNTAVGDSNVMASYMKNVSVNYFVGEIYLTHKGIQPTGSRDGFVVSPQKEEFDAIMLDKSKSLYQLYDSASHMGSSAIDKITNAHIAVSNLRNKLSKESDKDEKKSITKQIKEQENIIKTKSSEFKERIEVMKSTPEGEMVVNSLIEARQKAFNNKIEENNSKPTKPQIKKIDIIKFVEKNNSKTEEQVGEGPKEEKPQSIKDILMSKLSRDNKKIYEKVCEVIDNEVSLVPSYIESLKMKILKKIAK